MSLLDIVTTLVACLITLVLHSMSQSANESTSQACRWTEYDDIPSRTALADVVFDGRAARRIEVVPPWSVTRTQYFNVTFRPRRVYKGFLERLDSKYVPVVVGTFGSNTDVQRCVGSVELGARYFIFLQGHPTRSTSHRSIFFYRMVHLPEPFHQDLVSQIEKFSCSNCTSAPSAILSSSDHLTLQETYRLQLRCRAYGRPQPDTRWFKNGEPVIGNKKIRLKTGRHGSSLTIKKVEQEDSGRYACQAVSALGQTFTNSTTVTIESLWSPKPHSELCSTQTYCLNGGVCFMLSCLGRKYCQCASGFMGVRCQDRDLSKYAGPVKTPARIFTLEVELSIAILSLLGVVLLVLIAILCLLVDHRRHTSRRRAHLKKHIANQRREQETMLMEDHIIISTNHATYIDSFSQTDAKNVPASAPIRNCMSKATMSCYKDEKCRPDEPVNVQRTDLFEKIAARLVPKNGPLAVKTMNQQAPTYDNITWCPQENSSIMLQNNNSPHESDTKGIGRCMQDNCNGSAPNHCDEMCENGACANNKITAFIESCNSIVPSKIGRSRLHGSSIDDDEPPNSSTNNNQPTSDDKNLPNHIIPKSKCSKLNQIKSELCNTSQSETENDEASKADVILFSSAKQCNAKCPKYKGAEFSKLNCKGIFPERCSSDVDVNSPASDLEVNMESEVDIQALNASEEDLGERLQPAVYYHGHDESSVDTTDSDSSASSHEQQLLFKRLNSHPHIKKSSTESSGGEEKGHDWRFNCPLQFESDDLNFTLNPYEVMYAHKYASRNNHPEPISSNGIEVLVKEHIIEPILEPVIDLIIEPVNDPVIEPDIELVTEATTESVTEPVREPLTECPGEPNGEYPYDPDPDATVV